MNVTNVGRLELDRVKDLLSFYPSPSPDSLSCASNKRHLRAMHQTACMRSYLVTN
jgi:hypothetical protein